MGEDSGKAPFRILYNNDCTNILGCASPWHAKGEGFRPEMMAGSVDEAADAGVDVQLLSPGTCWVPWWPSEVCPDHYEWVASRLGEAPPPGSFAEFVANGGDVVRLFVDRCRTRGVSPFITYRINDSHHVWLKGLEWDTARFYVEHPECRLPNGPQNWAVPQVRWYKLDLIRELCENYDLDGVELDFMRHWWLFDEEETTREERVEIMTSFAQEVRDALDATARRGQRRYLCVRVPVFLRKHEGMGLDLRRLVTEAGVDMVNASASFVTHQEGDLGEIRGRVPEVALYIEMTQATGTAYVQPGDPEKADQFDYRRTCAEEFYTAAALAYEQGADGVSLFNFPYYRGHGKPGRGRFGEPPFHVIRRLADRDWLTNTGERYYFLTSTENDREAVAFDLPQEFAPGSTHTLTMRTLECDAGRTGRLTLRLHSLAPLPQTRWCVRLNGRDLEPVADVDEPGTQPYEGLLGTPECRKCFTGSADALIGGTNHVEVKLASGESATIWRVDCWVELDG